MIIQELRLAADSSRDGLKVYTCKGTRREIESCQRSVRSGFMSVENRSDLNDHGCKPEEGWRILRTCYGEVVWAAKFEESE